MELLILAAVLLLVLPSLLLVAVVVGFRRISRLEARVAELEGRGWQPAAASTLPEQDAETSFPLSPRERAEAGGAENQGVSRSDLLTPTPLPGGEGLLRHPLEEEEEPFLDRWAGVETPEPVPEDTPVSTLFVRIKQWLFGGNTVARVGAVVIFFGVAFLLKYAAEIGWLPIELRLAGAALGGIALIVLGWRLRERRRSYALVLQGAGIGVVYLSVFAAFARYGLLPPTSGLSLMVALVVLASMLAVLQDARSLAVLALTGGFLAPVLISSGGSHVTLFTYYAVLNAGILAIAWYKAWRELNLLGFLFTFVIGAGWGRRFYQPDYFSTTEPFLILFFLFYVAVPVLFARRQPTRLKGVVDGSLVFGMPLAAAVLQSALVRDFEYGMAFSALAAGLFYALLATGLWRRRETGQRTLVEAFIALAVAFGTLTIPLALDARLTGAAWALEGAALIWVGVRQRRLLARISGLLLQGAAGISLVVAPASPTAGVAVLNSLYLGSLIVALAGLFSARHLHRHRDLLHRAEADLSAPLLVWGLAWWFGAGGGEIWRHLDGAGRFHSLLLFVALSCAALAWLRRRLAWEQLLYPPLLLLPAMAYIALVTFFGAVLPHPLAGWGAAAWLTALAVQYGLLRRLENAWSERNLLRHGHLGTLWLLLFLLAWEAGWALPRLAAGGHTWGHIAWGLIPALAVVVLPGLGLRLEWPLQRFKALYLGAGLGVPIAFLVLWLLFTTFQPGDPRPLTYLPLLNPLELSQSLALLAVLWWHRRVRPTSAPAPFLAAWSLLAFVVLNGGVARAIHFIYQVPFTAHRLWDTPQFQTALSVTWTLLALGITIMATRLRHRTAWFVGAALLAAVVLKLFLVDLAGVGTVARIVSFLVVGVLILLIGYFSPLPPEAQEEAET